MAELFARKVMEGHLTFDEVPRLLKSKVEEILKENGVK